MYIFITLFDTVLIIKLYNYIIIYNEIINLDIISNNNLSL